MKRLTDLTPAEAAELRRLRDDRPDVTPWQEGENARRRVHNVARRVAASAPAKQGSYTYRAGVPWTLIHELREAIAELDALGAGEVDQ